MAVTLYVDLPLVSSAEPILELKGIWPSETSVAGSPFTLDGQEFAKGSFTANIGDLEPGIYRGVVTLTGVHIATGYVGIIEGATNARMVDDPQTAMQASAFAEAIASEVSSVMIAALLNRFTVSSAVGATTQQATQEIERSERLALGPLYTANFGAYTQADIELTIGVLPQSPDVTGRLVWTAKPIINGDQASIVLQVASDSGLVKPTGAPIVAGDAVLSAIPNATQGQPSRAAKVTILARAMAGVATGRLYWDLRRYIDAQGQALAESDVLATGILDLYRPVNQATG